MKSTLLLLTALAGRLDQNLADTEQAIDTGARDRFFSLNTAGNAWSRVQHAPLDTAFDPFESLGNSGLVKLAAERNADGRLSLFAIGGDGALYGRYQTSPGGGWNPDGWGPFGGAWIVQVITARNADGRIELFVRNTAGNVFHRYQVTPNGGWNPEGWLPFGGNGVVSISAATRSDGRLEVAGIGGDGHMYHRVQYAPGSGWDADWSLVAGSNLKSVALVRSPSGLQAIALDSSTGANVEEAHADALGVWSGFSPIGQTHMASVTVATMYDGRLDILGLPTAGSRAYQLPQTTTNSWTGTFAPIGWPQTFDQLATAMNADGFLNIFGRGSDGVVYNAMQDPRSTSWSAMGSLGGAWQTDLVAIDQQ